MTRRRLRRFTLAILLFAVSLAAIAPNITRADNQKQTGTINITATGQANPIDKKSSCGPASLNLTGSFRGDGNKLKINGLTGSLQIGSAGYPVSNGNGEANKKGTIEINGNTNGNGHHYELKLHGQMNGNNLVFDSHESKLSSLCFLSLSGQASMNPFSSTSSQSSHSDNDDDDEHGTTTTVTETVTVINGTTTTLSNNQTVTQTVTEPQNVTVTVTQSSNSTITETVTTTVANSTITQTATITVANTTITQTTTSTVANTTTTVFTTTNSTQV